MAASKNSQVEMGQRAGAEIVRGSSECYNHCTALLKELGFPRGVLPLKDLEECGIVRETGFMWMKQKKPTDHFFKKANSTVRYDTEVSAYVEKGKMKKMSGVKGKHLLLWVTTVEMSLHEDANDQKKIYFKTSIGVGKSLPIAHFMDDDDEEKMNKH